MASKGVDSGSRTTVTPAAALLMPVMAAMLPAVTVGTEILSPPTIMATCWTLSALAPPSAHTLSPCLIWPE